MEKLTINIDETSTGLRLDKALSESLPDMSRTYLQELITSRYVLVNGEKKKAKYTCQINDEIVVAIPAPVEAEIVPEQMDLEIVYEDEDVIVVNKPSGLVVHPSSGNMTGTLVNGLVHQIKDLSGINGVMRPGIVHRIDKDTSGLLMVAKNDMAHESLASQLREKTVRREYIALVHGVLAHDKGVIEAPIARDPKDRKRMAVVSGGKPAVTHFEVLKRFAGFTLVKCILETGRTHQIRVHMRYIEHPLAGDPIYGPRKTIKTDHGQFLHAKVIGFEHPKTGEHMSFDSELPDYFTDIVNELSK